MNLTEVMFLHITAGGFGLVSGATALLTRKGAWIHRNAGNVFVIAMILMAASGGALAVLKPAAAAFNVVVSSVTIYMVATSWMTVVRKEGERGTFEMGALLVGIGITTAAVALGLDAAKGPRGFGAASFLFFGFAAVAGLAAAADLSVIVRGGVSGAQRIARHLWRMSVAMFLATLAFFVGQGAKVFPQAIRDTGLRPLPMLIVLALMLFWLWRVLLTNWWRSKPE